MLERQGLGHKDTLFKFSLSLGPDLPAGEKRVSIQACGDTADPLSALCLECLGAAGGTFKGKDSPGHLGAP